MCDLGSMNAGQVATVTFRVAVAPTQTGKISNVASVTGYVPDPQMLNNTATAITAIDGQPDDVPTVHLPIIFKFQ